MPLQEEYTPHEGGLMMWKGRYVDIGYYTAPLLIRVQQGQR